MEIKKISHNQTLFFFVQKKLYKNNNNYVKLSRISFFREIIINITRF